MRNYLLLITVFGIINCFSQNYTVQQIDSLQKIVDDKDAFANLGHEKILKIANEVYISSRDLKYEQGQLNALKKIIEIYFNTNRFKEADGKISEALLLAEDLNDTYKFVSLLDYKAKYLIYLGFYREARENLNRALHLSEEIKDLDKRYILRASIYNSIAAIFEESSSNNKSDLDSLLHYVGMAYASAKKIGDDNPKKKRLVAQYARTNGATLLYEQKYDEAEIYLKESIELLKNEKDKRYIVPAYRFQAEIEYQRGNLSKAIEYFETAIQYAEASDYYTELVHLYPAIASPYKDLKDFEKASYYLDLSKKLNQKIEEEKKSLVEKVSLENEKENDEKTDWVLKVILWFSGFVLLGVSIFFIIRRKNILSKKSEVKVESTEIDLEHRNNIEAESIKCLKELARNDDESFYLKFIETFPYFNKKLLAINPNLSSTDFEYCALIKLDFTTKEIAQAKNISIRTVETKKYRLRKKLNLPEDIKNINTWFSDF